MSLFPSQKINRQMFDRRADRQRSNLCSSSMCRILWLSINNCLNNMFQMSKGYKDAKLQVQAGWWNDRQCEESRYSICQKNKQRMSSPETTVAPPAGCPFVGLQLLVCFVCIHLLLRTPYGQFGALTVQLPNNF